MTNFDIENELNPVLSPGEKLLWTGRPKTGIMFRASDAFLIPFSLLWCGFAIFWEVTALSMGAPIPMVVFGSFFVFVGLYLTIGRFFLDAKKRKNTVFGITPDRIIIKTGIFTREIISLNIRTLSNITLNQKADNSGTIMLGNAELKSTMTQGMEWPGVNQAPRLEFIEDVQSVYEKIIRQQR